MIDSMKNEMTENEMKESLMKALDDKVKQRTGR